ncbi:phosphorylase [Thermosynechococcus sp. QS41]|uniref:5'-methylthioadenosine/S-adenosylhomocysteine nucleosidase family protein n=1 Tax=unclassified Thermosynechococcus TaxID=2622553 RepID=UPI002873C157|nr:MULTISPECIES: phosphorylase [unclassified Thermosynechococcus]WNC22590.1 phosphorylase [Thermosynechococcus sp. PP22]WNC60686.1 phosphorylase [Thermosynechococcus sp. QS41]
MTPCLVLVPQGAEYQAVQRGLQASNVVIIPIRAGAATVTTPALISALEESPAMVLILGVCGGLHPDDRVGEVVVYTTCQDEAGQTYSLDQTLSAKLAPAWRRVKGITTAKTVSKAQEKQTLAARWGVEVVDMEGVPLLKALAGMPVVMVRVISDGGDRDLPDLSQAFDAQGNLRPGPLAIAMLRNPRAAAHLIQGSLKALKVLTRIAPEIVQQLNG